MRATTFASALALVLVAGAEAARPKPYSVARAPATSLFGLVRRDDDGYTPETEVCSNGGNTCAEACGSGYEQCASGDSRNHCFNPTVGDTCCGVNSGDACETGYYCAHDSARNTICCPDAMSLTDCAAALSPNDALTSDFPAATTPTTSTTASSTAAVSTTATTADATTTTAAVSSAVSASSTASSTASTTTAARVSQSSSSYTYLPSASYTSSAAPGATSTPGVTSAPGSTPIPGPIPGSSATANKAALGLAAVVFVALL